MNRRSFIGLTISVLLCWILIPARWIRLLFTRFRVPAIDNHALKSFICLADYIYPADQSPGAVKLGVADFCTAQISNAYYRSTYQAINRLTSHLDLQAGKSGYISFCQTPEPNRFVLFQQLLESFFEPNTKEAAEDFNLIVDFVIEASFSDPMHGGNKQKAAWEIFGSSFNEKWFYV